MPNTMENSKEPVYTLKEASRESGLSVAVLSKACRDRDLKGSQISDSSRYGYHWMIREYDLIDWMEKRGETRYKRKPKPPTPEEQKSSTWQLAYAQGYAEGYAKALRKVRKALKALTDTDED